MPSREIVATPKGPQLEAVTRAHDQAARAATMLRQVHANAQIARAHLADVLTAATGQPAAGLLFDPSTGSIYREVKE